MISSFAGKCLGNDGWANLKARTNGYLMPFIEAIEGQYNAWPSLDSWLWCALILCTLNPNRSPAHCSFQLGMRLATGRC